MNDELFHNKLIETIRLLYLQSQQSSSQQISPHYVAAKIRTFLTQHPGKQQQQQQLKIEYNELRVDFEIIIVNQNYKTKIFFSTVLDTIQEFL